ncbi:5657_t:CDS:2 [Acaulospora colombiana]|uniref:5657_t:CDS:1 n=1 Tax=Acaulospora colombiana TaxID=27376 RepID=A0ACA9JYK2_9GLOM|nr:5657_t:CDS:2 [Acaulospora colombiana]
MSQENSADVYVNFYRGIFLLHETLRSGMDQILNNAPNVCKTDVRNFIGYINAFISHLMSHHGHEEHIIFPAVTQKISVNEFIEDHKKLDKLVHSLSDYTKKVSEKKVSYESAKIVELMTQLNDLVRPHLKHEETSFSVEALRENMTKEELEKITNDINDSIKKEGGATTILPFLLLHLEPEDRQFMVYDSMPKPVKSLLLPVFINWNKGYWKYAKYQRI